LETLLVVEDDPIASKVMAMVLETEGYTVLQSNGAQAGFGICQEFPDSIHLLVTDAALRDDDGKKLAQQITALRPHIKVLYVSGHSSVELIRRGQLSWNAPFLQKPFTAKTLVQAVRKLLDNSDPK